jgi:hypothetical protein
MDSTAISGKCLCAPSHCFILSIEGQIEPPDEGLCPAPQVSSPDLGGEDLGAAQAGRYCREDAALRADAAAGTRAQRHEAAGRPDVRTGLPLEVTRWLHESGLQRGGAAAIPGVV